MEEEVEIELFNEIEKTTNQNKKTMEDAFATATISTN